MGDDIRSSSRQGLGGHEIPSDTPLEMHAQLGTALHPCYYLASNPESRCHVPGPEIKPRSQGRS